MKRKLKKLIFGASLAVVVAFASLGGVYAILDWMWGAELRETMRLLRDQGQPMDMASFSHDDPRPGDDASRIFENLFCRMTSGPDGEIFVPGVSAGVLDERLRILLDRASSDHPSEWDLNLKPLAEIAYGELMKEVVSLASTAAKKKASRFKFDYERRPLAAVPQAVLFERLTRLLCVKALIQARDGDLDACHEDLFIGLKVARLRRGVPHLVSQLSRCADASLLARTIRTIVSERGVTDARALSIINAIQTLNLNAGVKRGVLAERVMFGKNVFEPLIVNQNSTWRADCRGLALKRSLVNVLLVPVRKKDYTAYLALMSDVAALFDAPYWKVAREDKIERLTAKTEEMAPYCPITRRIIPDLSELRRNVAKVNAELAQCLIAIALRVHFNNEGTYPESLSELEPVILKIVPRDPLTGRRFGYEKIGDHFQLQSAAGL